MIELTGAGCGQRAVKCPGLICIMYRNKGQKTGTLSLAVMLPGLLASKLAGLLLFQIVCPGEKRKEQVVNCDSETLLSQ